MSSVFEDGRITAMLGPTNTGKTYFAIERMLGHASGMIGFPLRLLARENYERVVSLKGKNAVALITGEEKILPPHARYFICTVESMPVDRVVDFLAIDEIQLCGDRERGHVFTDRLLHARGRQETMFLGSDIIRPLIRKLVPKAEIVGRQRMSRLTYTGPRKLTRLPRRTAIVAFSAADVYVLAEIVRRQRGGAAVVLGALSPRARNAQVAMYQEGEVDYLIATDAIGMGLNMDVDHVAFAEDMKFDGRAPRRLTPPEMAQIAGRAGRHMNDGAFGVTGDCPPLDEEMVEALESHRFDPLRHVFWRNHRLSFRSLGDLQRALGLHSDQPHMIRKRDGEDHRTLESLARMEAVVDRATGPDRVRLLWDICQIPDFRKTMSESHANLLAKIYFDLTDGPHCLETDWVANQVSRFDRTDGDIDTLVNRIAHIRTWTYITHRADWVSDPVHWQAQTRAVEDRLSDALHDKLTQRFVDKRAALFLRKLKDGGNLAAAVKTDSTVVVEGHAVGHMEGLKFVPDVVDSTNAKPVLAAARKVLPEELARRTGQIEAAENAAFSIGPKGTLIWLGAEIASLEAGADILSPQIRVVNEELVDGEMRKRIETRLRTWLTGEMEERLGPLLAIRTAELEGAARGIGFQVLEGIGGVSADQIGGLRRDLDDEQRKSLARLGIRFGTETVFLPVLLKPKVVEFRAMLWSVFSGQFPEEGPPPAGRVMITRAEDASDAFYLAIGYKRVGGHAVRADMLERVAQMVRQAAREGAFAISADMLSLAGVGHEAMAEILKDLGYRRGEDVEEQPRFIARRRQEQKRRPEGARKTEQKGKSEAGDKAEHGDKPERARKPGKAAQDGSGEKRDRNAGAKGGQKGGPRKPKGQGDRPKRQNSGPKVISSNGPAMRPEDSPFAILQQLKLAK